MAKKNSVLFDNDPFYAAEEYVDNVVSVIPFESYSKEEKYETPVLMRYTELLSYLSKCDHVAESMRKIKAFWKEHNVIEFVEDEQKNNYLSKFF